MRARSRNPLHEGAPKIEIRANWVPITKDGHECRDRLPWGGITSPRACGCVGQCQYDTERKHKG